jgi:tight adherence protein B
MSAALMVAFAYRYYSQDYTVKQKVNRRLSLIEKTGDQTQALAILRSERGISTGSGWPLLAGLQSLFVQSGLRLEGVYFFSAIAGLSASITVVMSFVLGFHVINLVCGLLGTGVLVVMFARFIRDRRILRFSEQLPDVLDIIVRSLKAGHPMPVSLSLVAREMPDPAGTEFGIASDEITYGLALPAAMQNLSLRVGDPDFTFVVMAASVQAQTGGNLGEILARLSKLIRDRFKLRRKVHALTAEGRFSAVALTLLPIALFVVANYLSPKYFGDEWDNPIFRMAMAVAGILLLIGQIVMRQMVKFKY